MKRILGCCLLLLQVAIAWGQHSDEGYRNLALHLDGKDNKVCIGMDTLQPPWSLEVWLKGDGDDWNEVEAVIGGGEYSELNIADKLPLVVKKGYLHQTGTGITSRTKLDDRWHHAALTCDGVRTVLYVDGKEEASTDRAVAILPGTIGVDDNRYGFGGCIDEVRIWKKAVSPEVLSAWMERPVSPEHPDFVFLRGYYNFDDWQDEISLNWVGKGHLAYHIRNGRNDYKGNRPLATAIPNDNDRFVMPDGKQKLFNAVAIRSEWDVDKGTKDDPVLKLRIAVLGDKKPLRLSELKLDLSESTSLADIERVHVYYAGQTPRSGIREEVFGTGELPCPELIFRASHSAAPVLSAGINYFLVTFDVRPDAKTGDTLCASVSSFKLGRKRFVPETDHGVELKRVTDNSRNNPNVVKVLQWNIWHGGVHLGNEGQLRVLDLIRASNADVVTMQEGYGIQRMLADSLGFYVQTRSNGDNLALFSRYPLEAIPWRESFKSNPAKVVLPDGRKILVNDCWLRYAYRPEYTCVYPNKGLDPSVWVAEDSILALVDIRNIIEKDTDPYLDARNMPVIIGGDFNSCSHLDWTERAKEVHFGYGPVTFPVSRYLSDLGYRDSFRELNPDEVLRPAGTFGPIYGHLQTARIDFLYYRGTIKAVSSKIVRTSPEIDYVWPGDHAAVLTVFELTDAGQ